MEGVTFSIIVVALNPGERLIATINSIRRQKYTDFEVIVKDGGSTDGSIDDLEQELEDTDLEKKAFYDKVKIIREKDKGIYDGMNQAIGFSAGKYLIFMNCGDYFYSETTLGEIYKGIRRARDAKRITDEEGRLQKKPELFYGDIYDALRDTRIKSNPNIDGFACYRNIPCHQACVYSRILFEDRKYDTRYKVRADYEHFLYCFYVLHEKPQYLNCVIASYEGGGYSETEKGRKISEAEHREITEIYMKPGEIFRYRAALALTLQPLRTAMAESKVFGGLYQKLKKAIYR